MGLELEIVKICRTIVEDVEYGRPQELNARLSTGGRVCLIEEIITAAYTVSPLATPTYPISVAFVAPVALENIAEKNLDVLASTRANCETFINRLTSSDLFGRITGVTGRKVEEDEFDINVIGWRVSFNMEVQPDGRC